MNLDAVLRSLLTVTFKNTGEAIDKVLNEEELSDYDKKVLKIFSVALGKMEEPEMMGMPFDPRQMAAQAQGLPDLEDVVGGDVDLVDDTDNVKE